MLILSEDVTKRVCRTKGSVCVIKGQRNHFNASLNCRYCLQIQEIFIHTAVLWIIIKLMGVLNVLMSLLFILSSLFMYSSDNKHYLLDLIRKL